MTEVVIPLLIRDLTPEDLPSCAWWVSSWDRARLGTTLERAQRGEVDYLAAFPPSGLPVALGGIDYAKNPRAGTLWQLAVHGALQSCGTAPSSSRPLSTGSAPAAFTGPNWASKNATRGPARSMSGLATPPTAANLKRGMNKPRTGR